MPDTRELELWRLVNKAFQNSIEKFGDIFAKDVTRELLANGVTVQKMDGCKYCRIASYTKNPFTVITQLGREVKTQFNFCPNCGRRLPQPPKGG